MDAAARHKVEIARDAVIFYEASLGMLAVYRYTLPLSYCADCFRWF